jgi:hypothetical protein
MPNPLQPRFAHPTASCRASNFSWLPFPQLARWVQDPLSSFSSPSLFFLLLLSLFLFISLSFVVFYQVTWDCFCHFALLRESWDASTPPASSFIKGLASIALRRAKMPSRLPLRQLQRSCRHMGYHVTRGASFPGSCPSTSVHGALQQASGMPFKNHVRDKVPLTSAALKLGQTRLSRYWRLRRVCQSSKAPKLQISRPGHRPLPCPSLA